MKLVTTAAMITLLVAGTAGPAAAGRSKVSIAPNPIGVGAIGTDEAITVDFTLTNRDRVARKVTCKAKRKELSFAPATVTIPAGGEAKVVGTVRGPKRKDNTVLDLQATCGDAKLQVTARYKVTRDPIPADLPALVQAFVNRTPAGQVRAYSAATKLSMMPMCWDIKYQADEADKDGCCGVVIYDETGAAKTTHLIAGPTCKRKDVRPADAVAADLLTVLRRDGYVILEEVEWTGAGAVQLSTGHIIRWADGTVTVDDQPVGKMAKYPIWFAAAPGVGVVVLSHGNETTAVPVPTTKLVR